MARMHLLIDQNTADSVGDFFAERGHRVWLVRQFLGRMSPDQLIAFTAEDQGLIAVTHDKDFRRFSQLLPVGSRNEFTAGAGRISLALKEPRAIPRLQEEIEIIEAYFDRAQREGKRLFVRITETNVSFQLSGGRVRRR